VRACATIFGIHDPEPRPDGGDAGDAPDMADGNEGDGGANTDAFEADTVDAPRGDAEAPEASADGAADACDPKACAEGGTCCGERVACLASPQMCVFDSFRCRGPDDCDVGQVCCGVRAQSGWGFDCHDPGGAPCLMLACDKQDDCPPRVYCTPLMGVLTNCPVLPLRYCGTSCPQ
jgi:hypothetical protein